MQSDHNQNAVPSIFAQPPHTSDTYASTTYTSATSTLTPLSLMVIDSKKEDTEQKFLNSLDNISQQEKHVQEIKIDLEKEIAYLNELKQTHSFFVEERKHSTRKRKVEHQQEKSLFKDSLKDELDEIRNERPQGYCEYINVSKNRRCTKPSARQHGNRKEYCNACFSKVLMESYENRRVKRMR